MKLDLTTVKLRETGITDKMLSERSVGEVVVDLKNHAVGAEYDTKHPTMLLQIKGTCIYMYVTGYIQMLSVIKHPTILLQLYMCIMHTCL